MKSITVVRVFWVCVLVLSLTYVTSWACMNTLGGNPQAIAHGYLAAASGTGSAAANCSNGNACAAHLDLYAYFNCTLLNGGTAYSGSDSFYNGSYGWGYASMSEDVSVSADDEFSYSYAMCNLGTAAGCSCVSPSAEIYSEDDEFGSP